MKPFQHRHWVEDDKVYVEIEHPSSSGYRINWGALNGLGLFAMLQRTTHPSVVAIAEGRSISDPTVLTDFNKERIK